MTVETGTLARTDWRTPRNLFAMLDEEFRFTLDAAADDANHLVERYLTEAEDALTADWIDHVVWCNPPYGRGISRWARKFGAARRRGATVVALIPASTDALWWHWFVSQQATEVRLFAGRIQFDPAPDMVADAIDAALGGPGGRNRYTNALAVYRPGRRTHVAKIWTWDWRPDVDAFVAKLEPSTGAATA